MRHWNGAIALSWFSKHGKVYLCCDLTKLNKVLIRSVHRVPTLNDILLRLASVKYLTLIDASSGYHSLKLNERLSYLNIFSSPQGSCRYVTAIQSISSG